MFDVAVKAQPSSTALGTGYRSCTRSPRRIPAAARPFRLCTPQGSGKHGAGVVPLTTHRCYEADWCRKAPAAAGLFRPFAVSGSSPRARGGLQRFSKRRISRGSSPPTPGGPAQLTTSCMLLVGFIVSRSRARGGAGSLMAGKRRAIELACCAWTDLSQARIAAQVGWTQPYVGQIRAQLNTTIELPDHVVGVGGRRRPAKRSPYLSVAGPGGLVESRPQLHTELVMVTRCSWNSIANKAVIPRLADSAPNARITALMRQSPSRSTSQLPRGGIRNRSGSANARRRVHVNSSHL